MKVRKGGSEEIPLVQGKEHWLRFAGAAMKTCAGDLSELLRVPLSVFFYILIPA